jgi:group I intron endonuclease
MNKGIYVIKNRVNNKIYVGSSVNTSYRWSMHKSQLERNIHSNKKLQNSYNKYGKENFQFEIIDKCENNLLLEREQYWIDLLQPWFNICKVAGRMDGYKHSEETINKIKATKLLWTEDRKKEVRLNQSNKNIGKPWSEARRLAFKTQKKTGRFGFSHSEETKKKMSESKKGKTTWNKGLTRKTDKRVDRVARMKEKK